MSPLREDEVYIGAKLLLGNSGWKVIAGQPPKGCDHLPVVEIKAPIRVGLGSKGAFKPDLIATDLRRILLVECKPRQNEVDIAKLRGVLSDPNRLQELYAELAGRGLLAKHRVALAASDVGRGRFLGAIAHSGDPNPLPDLYVLRVESMAGKGEVLAPQP